LFNSKNKIWLFFLVFVIGLPVAFIATFCLFPFWSWIENTFGVESVGHSGPAEWCFYATYAILEVFFIGLIFFYLWSKKESN
jgi:hypothetical protein